MRQIWVNCIDSLCHAKRIWFYTFQEPRSPSFGWFRIYMIKMKVPPPLFFFKVNITLLYLAVYQSRFLNLKGYFSWFYYLHFQSNFYVFLIFKCSNFHLFRSFSKIFLCSIYVNLSRWSFIYYLTKKTSEVKCNILF